MATRADPLNTCGAWIRNPTSGCYRPRSCRDCLDDDRCFVGSSGYCVNTTQADSSYTHALTLKLMLPEAKDDLRLQTRQNWTFPADMASYCSDDEAVCKRCTDAQFWSPYANGSRALDNRFCIGAGDCVCISSCTHPEPWCEVLFQRNLTSFSTAAPPPPLPSPPSLLSELPTDDACRYSTEKQTCTKFRPCRDCLTKPGCRVSEYGQCERDPGGNPPLYDPRTAVLQNLTLSYARGRSDNATALAASQRWRFRSFDHVVYCPLNDPVCTQCTQSKFWLPRGQPVDSRFCVGANGCVCIANCVLYEDFTSCVNPSTTSTETDTHGADWTRVVMVVGAVALAALVFGVVKRHQRSARHAVTSALGNGRQRDPHGLIVASPSVGASLPVAIPVAVAAPSAPPFDAIDATRQGQRTRPTEQLELYGWISHRQRLIDAETRRLRGDDDIAPAHRFL